MSHDVFLSYSSRNKAVADAVCAGLENGKIRCWIAPRDVLPGSNYGESIVSALESCRVVVLIYSAASNVSPAVLREAERAMNFGKPIIPFRLEDVPMAKGMEFFLASCHWLDAMSPPMEEHIAKLSGAVRGLIAGGGWTGDGATGRRMPAEGAGKRRSPVVLWAAGVGGALVLAAVAAFFLLPRAAGPGAAGARQGIAAESPAAPTATAAEDEGAISLDLSVLNSGGENAIREFFGGTPPALIRYVAERAGDVLRISPLSEYLDSLREGAPVSALRARFAGASHFVASDVLLDLKMVNNSQRTIYYTEAVLEVESSTASATPLLGFDADPGHVRALQIFNEGWAPVEAATLRCHLARIGTVATFADYPVTRELGAIERGVNVPLDTALAGIRALDGQSKAACFGEIRYRWVRPDGSRAESSLRFQTEVPLVAPPATASPPGGRRAAAAARSAPSVAPSPPAAAIALRDEGRNYEVRADLSQYLKAGEPDRFQIAVSAPRTSTHRFRLKLVAGDNRKDVIRSEPILLEFFRPQTGGDR